MSRYQRPTGTLDTLPEDQNYWYHVRARARHLAELNGFGRIDVLRAIDFAQDLGY